jgi:hypothetical protein
MAKKWIEASAGGGDSGAAIGRRLSANSMGDRIESSETEATFTG